mgnify:CR=1 FL=1
MKRYCKLVLIFVWWFLVYSQGDGPVTVATVGPFSTEYECSARSTEIRQIDKEKPWHWRGQKPFISSCWQDREVRSEREIR